MEQQGAAMPQFAATRTLPQRQDVGFLVFFLVDIFSIAFSTAPPFLRSMIYNKYGQ